MKSYLCLPNLLFRPGPHNLQEGIFCVQKQSKAWACVPASGSVLGRAQALSNAIHIPHQHALPHKLLNMTQLFWHSFSALQYLFLVLWYLVFSIMGWVLRLRLFPFTIFQCQRIGKGLSFSAQLIPQFFNVQTNCRFH